MRIWRGWLLWAAAGVALATLPTLLAPELSLLAGRPDRAPAPPVVALLRGMSAVALLGCAGWWWAAATAVLVSLGRGRRGRPRGCPRWLHRGLLGLVGLTAVAGLAGPTHATPSPSAVGEGAASVRVVSGLPYPERAESDPPAIPDTPPRVRTTAVRVPPPPATRHVAVPGDTLWDLAAAGLSSGASAAEVTARWHRIYRHNRAAIGPDPDLLVPGTSLELPTPREENR
jgi:nucleoid-associated protein YgaU